MPPKYSLLIPVKNPGSYLESCVKTILSQSYSDFELIISNDHSTDDGCTFLKTLNDSRMRYIQTSRSMSMAEHWDWIESQSSGIWKIFIGQDDGLMPYFFEVAEQLTKIADTHHLLTIGSERAYYFWHGCEQYYQNDSLFYSSQMRIEFRSLKRLSIYALLGFWDYFELPQMYTSSLFHHKLIQKARKQQDGKFLVAHPQDACLAAIACSLESKTLWSGIPLGWVGSSPKSAGLAMSPIVQQTKNQREGALDSLQKSYESSIQTSQITYHERAGDFSISDLPIYYWQSLLRLADYQTKREDSYLFSTWFTYLFFALTYARIRKSSPSSTRLDQLKHVLEINHLNLLYVQLLSILCRPFYQLMKYAQRLTTKLKRTIHKHPTLFLHLKKSDNPPDTLWGASELIQKHIHTPFQLDL